MVDLRSALALALLLAACPGEQTPVSESSGDTTAGSTPVSGPSVGEDGPCPDGGSPCGSECVFIGSDESNCGGCGVVCGQGEECIAGECLDLDPCDTGPGLPCGAFCVDDPNTDRENCGGCGNNCGDDESCNGGMCVPAGGETTGPPPGTGSTTDDGSSGEPPGSSSGGSGSSTGG